MSYTPGPWKLIKRSTPGQFVPVYQIRTEDDGMICEVGPNLQEGNGRLLAAAPDLLSVCKLILEEWEKPTEGTQRGELIARLCQYAPEARAAIKKAEGK